MSWEHTRPISWSANCLSEHVGNRPGEDLLQAPHQPVVLPDLHVARGGIAATAEQRRHRGTRPPLRHEVDLFGRLEHELRAVGAPHRDGSEDASVEGMNDGEAEARRRTLDGRTGQSSSEPTTDTKLTHAPGAPPRLWVRAFVLPLEI